MYERFTDRARKVMQLANQEAQRFNHEYIGTEHILLGLVKEGSGVAANVLKNLNIDLQKIRLEVEKNVQLGSGGEQVVTGRLPHTPRAKKIIDYSIEEARNLDHNYVGTEHLLLGLLKEQDDIAAQVLLNLRLKLEAVREEVLTLLGLTTVRKTPKAFQLGRWLRKLFTHRQTTELKIPKPVGPRTALSIKYPSSERGSSICNKLQFEWIAILQDNLDLMFCDVPDIFIGRNHLIYPVEDNVNLGQSPDVYVAIGRPKKHRDSYKVWEESGIFPQVIFEVWFPLYRQQMMEDEREFYEKYGAEEYYIIYPDFPAHVEGWRRENEKFVRIPEMNGFISPQLKIRFESSQGQLAVFRPDGERFLSFVELGTQAEQERLRALTVQQRAETAEQRAAKLAARLRELGIDPDTV